MREANERTTSWISGPVGLINLQRVARGRPGMTVWQIDAKWTSDACRLSRRRFNLRDFESFMGLLLVLEELTDDIRL